MLGEGGRNQVDNRNQLLFERIPASLESAELLQPDPRLLVRRCTPPGPCRGRHYTSRAGCEDSELRHRDSVLGLTRCLRPFGAQFPEPVALTQPLRVWKWPSNSSAIPSRLRRVPAPGRHDSGPKPRESSPRSFADWPEPQPTIREARGMRIGCCETLS